MNLSINHSMSSIVRTDLYSCLTCPSSLFLAFSPISPTRTNQTSVVLVGANLVLTSFGMSNDCFICDTILSICPPVSPLRFPIETTTDAIDSLILSFLITTKSAPNSLVPWVTFTIASLSISENSFARCL